MKRYRGYYIDGFIFSTEKEIDEFLKRSTIDKLRIFCQMFASDRYTPEEKMGISVEISRREELLHREFGMDWDEIETYELVPLSK